MRRRWVVGSALVVSATLGCSDAATQAGGGGSDGPGSGGYGGSSASTSGAGTSGAAGLMATAGTTAAGAATSTGGTSGAGGTTTVNPPAGGAATGGAGGAVVNATCPGDPAGAYQGTVPTIPGTIQAEDFDPAGYFDATPGNEGGEYRTDEDVDIKIEGTGFAVGWMTAGEWLEYTVNIPVEGDYDVVLEVGAVDPGRTLELSSCGASLGGPIPIPQIAAWGDMATTSAVTIHLTAGIQVIRVTVGSSDYVDFDLMTLSPSSGGTGAGGAGAGGAGGTGVGGAAGAGGSGGKFVGNITTYDSVDTDGLVYSDYWDQITPENAGKWGSVQSSAGSGRNWTTLDAIYDYTQQKGILFKEHTFVWGAQQPSGALTETDVRSWMTEFCTRYPDTKIIDVVNEPPPHTEPSYSNAIGGGTNGSWQWITNAFTWAREACPNAILLLNDYNNIEWGDQNQHFIDIVNTIKAAGAPIDAIGAQSHGLSGGAVSTTTMKSLLTKLHDDTGLPVYITEYDIDDASDSGQLGKYQEHMPFFLGTDWIHGITIWGWIYGKTWVTSSGLIQNGAPRPAMTWLMDQLGRPTPP